MVRLLHCWLSQWLQRGTARFARRLVGSYSAVAAVGAGLLCTDVFTNIFTGVFTDVFTDVFTGAFIVMYSRMYSLTYLVNS